MTGMAEHVRAFDFKGLDASEASVLASSMLGTALELVRDGFVVTRKVEGGVVLLRSVPRVVREGVVDLEGLLGARGLDGVDIEVDLSEVVFGP